MPRHHGSLEFRTRKVWKGRFRMCLAIPGEIVRIEDEMATVRVGEALRKASLMLLQGEVKMGDYVIVHAGFALHKVDPEEAKESLRLLQELAALGTEEGY
jgi:hydrogenase expression/formation protein HypC